MENKSNDNNVTVAETTSLVTVVNNTPITTSRIVAEQFGKRHDNVLAVIKAISNYIEDVLTVVPMFHEKTYIDKYGHEKPMYEMTRDGFTLLAMSFTGVKAIKFKLIILNAIRRQIFNA